MFGLGQAFAKFFKSCLDGPSGLQNLEFCSDQPIWPPKTAILSIYQCYVLILEKNHSKNHSPLIPSAVTVLLRPFLWAATMACHQYIWKVSPHRIENPDILVIKSKCSAILAECGCCIQVKIWVIIRNFNGNSSILDNRLKVQLKSIEWVKQTNITQVLFKEKKKSPRVKLVPSSVTNTCSQAVYQLHYMLGLSSGLPIRYSLCSAAPSGLNPKFDP